MTVFEAPVGLSEKPVGAPGGWKARTLFDTGDHSLHSFDLFVERTSKVRSSVLGFIVTTVELAEPV